MNKTNSATQEYSIGIFDSGIGGLTVVKEIVNCLPSENIIYLGDTARVPYGTKSAQTVVKYAESNAHFLVSRGIKMLVVACNTASAYAIGALEDKVAVPVVGVIKPGAKKAVESTRIGKVGVIGTPSTINSSAYTKEIKKLDPDVTVFTKACPLFVPLAEEGWVNNSISKSIAREYLAELNETGIDTLILGCTHYPILKETIASVMGDNVTLVDSAEAISAEVVNLLVDRVKKNSSGTKKTLREYYLTDNSETFLSVANNFLGEKIESVNLVDIV